MRITQRYLLLRIKLQLLITAEILPFMKKENVRAGSFCNFYLETFTKIHLYSEFDGFELVIASPILYSRHSCLLILVIVCLPI